MWRRNRVWLSWSAIMLLATFVAGCALLTAGVDRNFLQKLRSLEAYHLNFIDEFTAGPGKQWDQAKLDAACAKGNSMFQEAAAYAEGKGGQRKDAVDLVHDVFKNNCAVLARGSLLSSAASQELRQEVQENYADAIAGECSRAAGSPATC